MTPRCYLDMDGVLADFVGGISRAHNRPSPYDPSNKASLGDFNMERLWGMSPRQFWSATEDWEFWANLQPTEEAHEIVRLAEEYFEPENVCVLTAPAMSVGCVPGKREWMRRHFPQLSRRMIFGSAKEFLSGTGRLLVDDKDTNCTGWEAEGGYAILLPRLWNARHWQSNNTGQVLREEMEFACTKVIGGLSQRETPTGVL